MPTCGTLRTSSGGGSGFFVSSSSRVDRLLSKGREHSIGLLAKHLGRKTEHLTFAHRCRFSQLLQALNLQATSGHLGFAYLRLPANCAVGSGRREVRLPEICAGDVSAFESIVWFDGLTGCEDWRNEWAHLSNHTKRTV